MNENDRGPGDVEPTLRDDLYSVKEAAHYLGVSESTIWRWIDRGILEPVRVGPKRVFLRRADLEPERSRSSVLREPSVRYESRRSKGMAGEADDQPRAERTGPPDSFWKRGWLKVEVPKLTAQEKQRALEALERARTLSDAVAAKYGTSRRESWELLNESRDERTRELATQAGLDPDGQ